MPTHEGKISEDYTLSGTKICALVLLNSPAGLFQPLVNVLARVIFGAGHGAQNARFPYRKHLDLGESLPWKGNLSLACDSAGIWYEKEACWRAAGVVA